MPSTKRTMVRHELSSSLPHVLPLILQVLQQPSQGEMTVQAIKCLQAWVQFGIPMEETAPIVQRLLLAGKNVLLNLFILSCRQVYHLPLELVRSRDKTMSSCTFNVFIVGPLN